MFTLNYLSQFVSYRQNVLVIQFQQKKVFASLHLESLEEQFATYYACMYTYVYAYLKNIRMHVIF